MVYRQVVNRHPTVVAVALFLNFLVLISMAAYWLVEDFKENEKIHAFENLLSIGNLKAGQIQQYLQTRKGDAVIVSRLLNNSVVQRWLKEPIGHVPPAVQQSLDIIKAIYQLGGLQVLDNQGNVRYSTGRYQKLSETAKSLASQAALDGFLGLSPIYAGDSSIPDRPLLDVFAPLVDPGTSSVIGVLVLRDDLQFLFSLIQSWPVESSSGETLLVRRDGDDVLFLNELRFKKNTALSLRIPIERDADANHIPTVEMMKGVFGALEGHDYRGHPVFAYNIAVPDTAWGMVVKMDEAEIRQHTGRLQVIVMLISLFFIAGAGVVLWLWWKKQSIEQRAQVKLNKLADDLRISAIAFETHEAIVITDNAPRIMRVNQAFQDITGYRAEEVIGRNPNILSAERKPRAFYEEMWATIHREGKWSGELLDRRKDGEAFPKWMTITAVTAPDGKLTHYVGSFFDITERKRAENALRDSRENLHRLLNSMAEGAFGMDNDCNCTFVNLSFLNLLGYEDENEVLGKNIHTLVHHSYADGTPYPQAECLAFQAGRTNQSITVSEDMFWRKDGSGVPVEYWAHPIETDGVVIGSIVTFVDITQRKRAESEIHRLAFFDPLTNLPNRRLLLDRLQHALANSARSGRYGAIMFIDLDNFKIINDTRGHDSGDLILVETARRLQSCVREGDTVARLGGDEFVVMLEDLGGHATQAAAHAEEVGEKIRDRLHQPYTGEENEYRGTASIGISLFVDRTVSAEVLLKNADIAMYQAKGAGRNAVRFFNPAMQAVLEARTAIESDLHRALEGKQLMLHYQAQVDADGAIVGAEALVRWIHPARGRISPAYFIPIAEESSLILEVGHWVLDAACRQLAAWGKDEKCSSLALAVNVSARQLKSNGFVNGVAELISRHGIGPSQLKLELTESVVMEDLPGIVAKMHALKELGVGLSMDDFGTGYSSLSYLKQLPIDQLKIDKSFINDIAADQDDAIMVQTIISLAHNFGLNVIAEGVETVEQLVFLKRHGCTTYQGYLFSEPVPLDVFESLLDKPLLSAKEHVPVWESVKEKGEGIAELVWSEHLSVGNEKIDSDHKTLITMVNGILYMIKARSAFALREAFDQLEYWLHLHFDNEENIAREINFPFAQNRAEHEQMSEDLQRMKEVFCTINGEWSDDEAEFYAGVLGSWITDHVLSEDMLMKPVLQTYPYKFMSD